MKNDNNFYDNLMVKMGFLLHKKFSIHLLIVFIINLLAAITVTGIFNAFNNPLITYKIMAFILFIIITSLMEVLVKVFILRHFIGLLFKTFGLLTAALQMLVFMFGDIIVDEFIFNDSFIISSLIFTISFIFIRTLLVIFYQKYILRRLIRED